jgi:hypothetical protein
MTRLHIWLTRRLRELRERSAKRAQAETSAAVGAATPKGPRLIYLHARPDCESVRADVDRALKGDGILPVTAPDGAAGGGPRTGNLRQASEWKRLNTAKR